MHFAGYAQNGSRRHIANPQRKVYSGMTEQSLCGVKVYVAIDLAVGSAAGFTQPPGTCKRCAASLGQTVRTTS